MKKVIALLSNGDRVMTTQQTAEKNNYWITHQINVELLEVKKAPREFDATVKPEIGNVITGIGGRYYKILNVTPIEFCKKCGCKATHKIGYIFYCKRHFNQLVITKPIKRVDAKINRNAKCPCGSNKKFKNCCLKKQEHKSGHYYNSDYKRKSA